MCGKVFSGVMKYGSVQAILDEELAKLDATGVLLGVSDGVDLSMFSAGDIGSDQHQSAFYIYSISKSITAVAIMLLVERDLLVLDDAVISLIEAYPEIPEDVTIRQLLNHTSGLSDYFAEKEYQNAVQATPDKPWDYEKLMKFGLRKTPLFEAGSGWSYSNPAYGVLKELIEKVSGEEYYQFVSKEVLKPLGMEQTLPFDRLDHGVSLLGGAAPNMKGDFREVYDPGWIATGSFIATIADVITFYQGLFGGALLSEKSLREMKSTVAVLYPYSEPREPCYGLGLMSFGSDPFGENYGHGGGGPGYATYAQHFLNVNGKSLTLTLVVNASLPQTPFSLIESIMENLAENEM